MKIYFLAALLLVCTCSLAQKPVLTDDLNNRMDVIVRKHIPFSKDEMLWSNYLLDPVQFNEMINQARNDAYRQIKSGNARETALKRLNADYYLRGVLSHYETQYGLDSAGFAELVKRLEGKSNAPLMDMVKKARLKTMTGAQRKYVDSLVYSNTDPNNAGLFRRSSAYRAWVDNYLNQMYKTKYQSDTTFKNTYIKDALPVSVVLGEIQNPLIRDYECYHNASDSFEQVKKDSALANKIYSDFNAAVTNPYYRGKMQQVYDNYKRMQTAGAPAPDFTYTAIDGKPITLSSLRGKYVYIDVWATWCAPCKGEIPYLVKLEEECKGKNIQFVSLSVDYQAQAGAWRKYVTDNKLTGYQVRADKDFKSDFIEKFNIVLIPRFILIDPAGNVVDADAKRPSDPALKKQFDELLR